MASVTVELAHVAKRYGTRPALSDVSFALHAGESVGYLGPNGAGKTTTLKLLAGLASPDAGTLTILGETLRPGRAVPRRGVGALVGTPGLLPYVTGRDLLEYAASAKGLPLPERPGAIRRVAERLALADRLDQAVGSLSTGLSRRLLLTIALLGDPELLLLDEPTLGLDPIARRELRVLLRELRGEGRTLLLSTHLLEDVEAVCDRVLFLREGRVVGDEPLLAPGPVPSMLGERAVRLRFDRGIELERLLTALPAGARPTQLSPSEWEVHISGGDAAQQELLATLVRAGLPLLELSLAGSDLERRYLAAVGHEEEG